jgi:hypothetical protein
MADGEFRFKIRQKNKGYVVIQLGMYSPETSPGAEDDVMQVVFGLQTGNHTSDGAGSYSYSDVRLTVQENDTSTVNTRLAGAWTDNAVHDIEIMGNVSQNPAVGYIRVLIDGSEVFLYNGTVFDGDGSSGNPVTTKVDMVYLEPSGREAAFDDGGSVTNVELDDVQSSTPLVDMTSPCCSDEADPTSPNAGSTPAVDDTKPLAPWVPTCTAGALLPSGNADTNSEDWRVA